MPNEVLTSIPTDLDVARPTKETADLIIDGFVEELADIQSQLEEIKQAPNTYAQTKAIERLSPGRLYFWGGLAKAYLRATEGG